MDIPLAAEMTDDDIDRAIRMHEGIEGVTRLSREDWIALLPGDSLPGFPSPDTFEYLALQLGCSRSVQSQYEVGTKVQYVYIFLRVI